MKKVKARANLFFNQSFRRHGSEEYGELFTRGISNREGTNGVYPWFYLRVFCVLAVVYTVYAVIDCCMIAGVNSETFYFVGGAFLDVALLVLFFELYAYNDFSLLSLLCVCIVGGGFAQFLCGIIYSIFPSVVITRGWELSVTAGVGEEIAKAIPAFICIILLKKKDKPFAGFLIGAAVGTWFSFTENAAYIHGEYINYMRVLTATARAFGAPFSHMMWTALICWAFCKFKRPFINVKFYAVVLFCMAMHFCIDMPLWDYIIILFAEAAVCGIATFIFGVVVIYKERQSAFPETKTDGEIIRTPLSLTHITNITLSTFGAVLCALLLLLSAVFSTKSYIFSAAYTEEELIRLMHGEYNIEIDSERAYDDTLENYTEYYEQGVLTVAEQSVEADNFTYIYKYELTEIQTDEQTEAEKEMLLTDVYIIIEEDGIKTPIYRLTYLVEDGNGELVEISFFRLNTEVRGILKYENGKYVIYKAVNRLTWQSIVVMSVTAAVGAAAVCTYLVLRKKAKKQIDAETDK